MGPADISDMSSTSNNQTLSLPKLKGDSSNWATYSERILNYLTSKGFRRHVQGTARKPETLSERNGAYYKSGVDQSQAAVREVIYRTIDKTTFLQVKNEVDAAAFNATPKYSRNECANL